MSDMGKTSEEACIDDCARWLREDLEHMREAFDELGDGLAGDERGEAFDVAYLSARRSLRVLVSSARFYVRTTCTADADQLEPLGPSSGGLDQ